jgi:hypothetical protein
VSVPARPLRPPNLVREEIRDLQSYLAGLPPDWREAGSFLAYEEKLSALDQELALAQIGELARSLNLPRRNGRKKALPGPPGSVDDETSLVSILTAQERVLIQSASRHARRDLWLSWATAVAVWAAAAFALVPTRPLFLTVLAAAAAVSAASAMIVFRWSDRAREETKLADYLRVIRNEALHLQSVPDATDRELDELRASARVEALISEVLVSQGKKAEHPEQDSPAA